MELLKDLEILEFGTTQWWIWEGEMVFHLQKENENG